MAVEALGAVPVCGHATDGNPNGPTAIAGQLGLLQPQRQPRRLLLSSERGTSSAGHAARCRRQGSSIRHTDPAAVARRVVKPFGKRGAASYFTWERQPLAAAEQAALPAPGRGGRRPSQRFVYHLDAARAAADAHYDGRSALVTTAPLTESGDSLFSGFERQNAVERSHQQWKTPLAVHPLFLKNPQRREALVHGLRSALMAYHLPQRR